MAQFANTLIGAPRGLTATELANIFHIKTQNAIQENGGKNKNGGAKCQLNRTRADEWEKDRRKLGK